MLNEPTTSAYVDLKECRTTFSAANELLFALGGEKRGSYVGLDGVFGAIRTNSRIQSGAFRNKLVDGTNPGWKQYGDDSGIVVLESVDEFEGECDVGRFRPRIGLDRTAVSFQLEAIERRFPRA